MAINRDASKRRSTRVPGGPIGRVRQMISENENPDQAEEKSACEEYPTKAQSAYPTTWRNYPDYDWGDEESVSTFSRFNKDSSEPVETVSSGQVSNPRSIADRCL
eukprot:81837_1